MNINLHSQNADISGYYDTGNLNSSQLISKHKIHLTLTKDRMYELQFIDRNNIHSEFHFYISIGSFVLSERKLLFRDTIYNIEFEAKLIDNKLEFTNSFKLLEKVVLFKIGNIKSDYEKQSIHKYMSGSTHLLSKYEDIFNYDIEYRFTTGLYRHSNSIRYNLLNNNELNIRSDSTFIYKYLGRNIIGGGWTKTGNKIMLKDMKTKMVYRTTVVGNDKLFVHDLPIWGYETNHARSRIIKLMK